MPQVLRVEIIGDAIAYTRALRKATAETEGFAAKTGTAMVGVAKGVGIAGLAIAGTMTVIGVKSAKAALEAQASAAKLDAAFKAQKDTLRSNSEAVEKVEAADRKLGFTNEQTRDGLTRLVQSGHTWAETTQLMGVATDLARAKHMELGDAATALIKLQTGQTRAARQFGLVLAPTTAAVDKLKASHVDLTTAAGKAALAQAKVQDKMATGQAYVDALTAKIKGQGEAFAGTAAGGTAQFHAQLQNIEEELGARLLPSMTRTLDWINAHWPQIDAVVQSVATGISFAVNQLLAPALRAVIQAGEYVVAWFRANWTQISTITMTVFNDVKAVVTTVVAIILAVWRRFGDEILSYVRATWNNIRTYIQGVLNIIRGIINIVLGLIHGDWSRVWQGIKQVLGGVWTAIVALVRQEIAYVQLAIRAGLDALVAYWRGMWAAIQAVAARVWSAIVAIIRGAVGAITSAAKAVGDGIVHGIESGLAAIVRVVKGGLDKIWGVISGVAKSAFGAAIAIGKEIMHGIAQGIIDAVGSAIHAMTSAVGSVIGAGKHFLHIGSPSRVAAEEIGKPIVDGIAAGIIEQQGKAEGAAKQAAQRTLAGIQAAQIVALARQAGSQIGLQHALGIVQGLVAGTPSIVAQAKTALNAAVTAAREAVTSARAGVASAFGSLAQDALSAFDTQAAKWIPPSLLKLQKMQLDDQINQAKAAVTDAATQLQTAQAQLATDVAAGPAEGETPEKYQERIAADQAAITTAEKSLGDAKRAQVELNLQLEATQEQTAHDKRMGQQREHLAAQLLNLQTELAKHPEEWKKVSDKVVALLAKYHVPMYEAGQKFASRFADGLRAGIGAVQKAAADLASALDKYVPHSPAEKGPLDYDSYDAGYKWASRFSLGLADAGFPGGGGAAGAAGAMTAGGGGGGLTVNVSVPGTLVGTDGMRQLSAILRDELRRYGRNNNVDPLAI